MAAYADQYDDFAVISSTLGVQGGRVCVGEASRGDIGCPAYAPSVASDGSISATRFVGDGSGLTGLVGSSVSMSVNDLTDARTDIATDNLFVGSGTGDLTTGDLNTAIGLHTFISNTAGLRSTAVGSWVLTSNTTGSGNTAMGHIAMRGNTTGNYNTALGQAALVYNTIGSGNTALGQGAMARNGGDTNVAVGSNALFGAIGGYVSSTVAMGSGVGFVLTAGQRNVFLGYYAAGNLAAGDNNIVIGSTAAYNMTSGSGNIIIGKGVNAYTTTTMNQLNISNTIIADMTDSASQRAKVGINVTSPSANLEVSGTISATRFVGDGSGLFNIAGASADRIVSGTTSMLAISNTGYISVTQSGVNTAYFHPSMGLVTVGVSSTGGISGTTGYFSGNVGIGTTAPSYTLHLQSGASAGSSLGLFRAGNGGLVMSSPQGGGGGFVSTIAQISSSGSVVGQLMFSPATGKIGLWASNLTFTPSQTLHIGGTLLTTSWTGVNFNGANVTPSAPLEVNGTVSATAGYFSGNVNLSNIATVGVSGTIFTVSNSVGSLFTTGNSANYFDIKSEGSVPILRLVKNTTQWSIGFPGSPNATSDPWQRGLWFVPYYTTTGVGATPTLVLENTGAVGIGGITQPSASLEVSGTVSATVLQVANTAPDSACAGASDLGKMRRNPTTGRMQVCR